MSQVLACQNKSLESTAPGDGQQYHCKSFHTSLREAKFMLWLDPYGVDMCVRAYVRTYFVSLGWDIESAHCRHAYLCAGTHMLMTERSAGHSKCRISISLRFLVYIAQRNTARRYCSPSAN